MFYLDLVEYEKADSEKEDILVDPVVGGGSESGVVPRSSNQVNVNQAENDLILFVEEDWVVLGGEETAGHQDLRSQSESASVTAYSPEQDTSQIPAVPPTTRAVFLIRKKKV